MLELFVGKMIFSVLIAKFKLRRFCFAKSFLEWIKLIAVRNEGQTLVIVTFIDRAIFSVFPKIKRMIAMRAPELGFVSQTAM